MQFSVQQLVFIVKIYWCTNLKKICGLPDHLTSHLPISSCEATLRTEYTRIDLKDFLNSVRQLRNEIRDIKGGDTSENIAEYGVMRTVVPGCRRITFSTHALKNLPKVLYNNSGHIARMF